MMEALGFFYGMLGRIGVMSALDYYYAAWSQLPWIIAALFGLIYCGPKAVTSLQRDPDTPGILSVLGSVFFFLMLVISSVNLTGSVANYLACSSDAVGCASYKLVLL